MLYLSYLFILCQLGLAALVGAGVLAAIMSTADGLLVSTSQIFANDIYRRSIAPRLGFDARSKNVDEVAFAYQSLEYSINCCGKYLLGLGGSEIKRCFIYGAGIGGMLAAISGPLFVGIFWKGTTRSGAIAGLFMGGISFLFFKLAVIEMIFGVGEGGIIVLWLVAQAVNPLHVSLWELCFLLPLFFLYLALPNLRRSNT